MSKHKSDGKDKKKGSQLVIRVDRAERDAFVSLCDRQDTSAAREIRRFMRERVAAAAGAAEATLIEDAKDTAPNDEAATAQPEADIDPKADDAEPPKKKHKHHRH